MGRFAEFMDKVKADESLQKEFAGIIGDSGEKLTKEQKEKIAELAGKLGIELNIEGELSDEALGSIAGGGGSILWEWPQPLPPPQSTMVWEMVTYRCKNCGKTKTLTAFENPYSNLEHDCPAAEWGVHEYELIE